MRINADIRREVVINPVTVMEQLIEEKVGHKGFVFEKDYFYYIDGDDHREPVVTTRYLYDYIKALNVVKDKLLAEQMKR